MFTPLSAQPDLRLAQPKRSRETECSGGIPEWRSDAEGGPLKAPRGPESRSAVLPRRLAHALLVLLLSAAHHRRLILRGSAKIALLRPERLNGQQRAPRSDERAN